LRIEVWEKRLKNIKERKNLKNIKKEKNKDIMR
jgi:hypothetical protein